ncbi:predicted protein [Streptomyces viridosporus ATCC 14672]|uniref:Predicted protein n=1 Tax=Streptomyces viridosporus (strain ATCC 14672 / DSM 40746 / JCM 4963 / KCTC 9882 / NRRL B-12104 / FH 1290) TaxID=566461 RepID=D5ZU63_STRV1|nr:predicted protein [Streptomyces viridosporus ATCC 14672]
MSGPSGATDGRGPRTWGTYCGTSGRRSGGTGSHHGNEPAGQDTGGGCRKEATRSPITLHGADPATVHLAVSARPADPVGDGAGAPREPDRRRPPRRRADLAVFQEAPVYSRLLELLTK